MKLINNKTDNGRMT